MKPQIKLIAVDIDGTLLNSQHELTPRTERALRQAMAQGIPVILATGKTRTSALDAIARLGLATPGVYLQGLAIYNGDGTIRYQQTLDLEVARQMIAYSEARDFPLVAYCGTRILTRERSPQVDRLIKYHEPTPEPVGSLLRLLGVEPIHKVIFISDAPQIKTLRAELNGHLGKNATLVQALDDMLEVLPPGASKGSGLRRLLADLEVAPENVLAIGDGENDVEMLQLAGVGVAVANAMPAAKAAADFIVASHDDDGVAEAIERFVL
jgi:Cof subfamily protein (haloacid dehalogenase superfamily)